MILPRPVRVVGVGSPWGDDSLAWEVIRQLRNRHDLPPAIELFQVDGGQRILDILDGEGTLVLVDAALGSASPGTIHRFEWPNKGVEILRPGTTHHWGPAEALRLAAATGIAPPRIVILAMEIEKIDSHAPLSPIASACLPGLVELLLQELGVTKAASTPYAANQPSC